MTFTVTYRSKDGKRAEEVVEATDRADCFRILKSRGLSPISVAEGGEPLRPKAPKSRIRGVVAGALVVILVGAAFVFLQKSRDAGERPRPKAQTKAVERPATPGKAKAEAPVTAESAARAGVDLAAPVVRSATNRVIKTKRPGKKFRIVNRNAGKKQLFHTISDVYISRVVNSHPGSLLVGTIDYGRFKDQFLASLSKPIVIDPDDSPEDVARKKAVIETRKELKERLDNGEDIAAVMREAEAEARRLFDYRRTLQKELAAAFKERKFDANDMKDYVDAANKMLTDNGMKPLKYPEMWIRRLRQEMSTPVSGAPRADAPVSGAPRADAPSVSGASRAGNAN